MTSRRTSSTLIALFRIEIGLTLASMVFYAAYRLSTGEFRFNIVGNLIFFSEFAWLLSSLIIILLFPIWLYKLNHDLSFRFVDYPIRPWQTILWYIIPFYSVWGMLKYSKILTDYLLNEEDENFEVQRYSAIDPRYQGWIYLYIFLHEKKFKGHEHNPFGFQLLKIFAIFYPIWVTTILLSSAGFGTLFNILAPAVIVFFHNVLIELPVYGWMPGFPSFGDTLLKAGFLILLLNVLIKLVRVSQKIVVQN